MMQLLLIAAGGALGAASRFALSSLTQRAAGPSFPAGTLLVNVLGCLLIGVCMAWFAGPHGVRVREEHRAALLVGVLGGFTTFSTFAWETFAKFEAGEHGRAAANLLLTNALCIAAVLVGHRLGQRLLGP